MSDYHWSTLEHYQDHSHTSEKPFYFARISSLDKDRSIPLPQILRENIGTGQSLLQVLCFLDTDNILPYPYMITCIHPKHTSLLEHLADKDPDKWFWGTIDKDSRLHLPLDTLETIRITTKAFIAACDDFSWYISDPEQQILSSRAYLDALTSGEASIPEEELGDDTDTEE